MINQKTTSAVGMIGLLAMGGALVGFLLQLLVAYYFGASRDTDAFFMASSTAELLGKLLLGGSITAVFLPLFVDRINDNDRTRAWELALNVLHIFSVPFAIAIVLLGIHTTTFVQFIAPGFDAPTTALTVTLLRILLPSFWLLFLVDLAVTMLHALKHFTIPASLRIVTPLLSVITLLIGHTWGIYALAVGGVLGASIQLCLVGAALYYQGFRYTLQFDLTNPAIQKLLYLLYPFIFSSLVTQAAGIVYRILVSDLSVGSLSALKYAEKITQLLTIIFLNALTTVMYPQLAELASRRNYVALQATLLSAVRITLLVTIPLTIGVALLRMPLIALLYQRGSFTSEDAALTGTALLFLVLGLSTTAVSSLLGHAVLALQRTRAAVAVTVASQCVAIILFILLVPRLAHGGLALASALVPVGAALLYYLYLRSYLPHLRAIFYQSSYIKLAVLGSLLWIVVYVGREAIGALPAPSGIITTLQLLVPTLVGCVVFFGGAYWWNIPEAALVLATATSKLRSWRR